VAIQSSDGSLENVSYNNLDLTAAYLNGRASARPLSVGVFGGSLRADADAVFGAASTFNVTLAMQNLNLEQALRSQNVGTASTVHGLVTGNVAVTGSGASWIRIRPTLRGSGRVSIANGKLVGINIVADALNAVAKAPGVSQIMTVAFMSSHHGLLVDPDTELQSASMSFQQVGPRFTTHDLFAQSPDYAITGDGWFDMDKNINMEAHVILTPQLSKEIIAEKHNVVYLTDKEREVVIPMLVSGHLPKPVVVPDLAELAQRATTQLIQKQGAQALGKLLGKKGKNLNIPFLNDGGGSGNGGNSNPPSNPLDQLKGLFH
jgi:hypothetical protein